MLKKSPKKSKQRAVVAETEETPSLPVVRVARSHKIDPTRNWFKTRLDPAHFKVAWFGQDLVQEIWADKYKYLHEISPTDTFMRVAQSIYQYDSSERCQEAFECMDAGLWMPGGRIIAGAGTQKRVTLMNCYVNKRLEDSLDDIMQGVSIAALTQQQGGGIGTDFSTLRPQGAILRRTGAQASGPLPFMDMWHSMCSTIMSAGDRRGAMMGTISDTHPDLPLFIIAKQTKGRLTNFNVSILVSDAFMEAIREDEDWLLHFEVEPKYREPHLTEYDFADDDGKVQYVYSVHKARDLWTSIIQNTYEWSEPGIIFIDRINGQNNLHYCEEIHCTNPCGEQPLPPNGTCNLGAINLSKVVKHPFKPNAEVNWELLTHVSKVGLRFLDNVIDITNYPLPEQQAEELSKRRTGLGVSGLANCLAQLGLRYGSAEAVRMTERLMSHVCLEAYEESMDLAVERGPFPLFDAKGYLDNTFAGTNLSEEYKERIRISGIRNGVLMTVAPTGTTSILYGNVSGGIEPVFAHQMDRQVRQQDDTFKKYTSYDYNALLYHAVNNAPIGSLELPPFMVTVEDLTIEDHVATQAAVQRWVDASVSKTVNVAERVTYEDFRKVYDLAYTLGCKGCTTYRPSEIRGTILSKPQSTAGAARQAAESLARRDPILNGITRKVNWPSMASALYVTVNYTQEGEPFEVFFNSKDARSQEWMTALSLMVSAILRKGGNIDFIGEELSAVHSIHDTAWLQVEGKEGRKFFGSLIAYLGYILGKDFTAWKGSGAIGVGLSGSAQPVEQVQLISVQARHETCPQCLAPALIRKEGCKSCENCGYSDCQ